MWRHVASNFLTIAILLLVAAAGVVAWGQRQYTGPGPLAEPICFQVRKGANLKSVASDLSGRGAIRSGYILKVGADYQGKAGSIKAGSYLIAPNASMAEIVEAISGTGQSTCGTEVNYRIGVQASEMLVRELDPATNRYVEVAKFDPAEEAAPQAYVDIADDIDVRFRVTLAEGATSWQVVEALKRAEFLDGEIGTVPPEGMLAPDSYEVARGLSRSELLDRMQARQAAVLDALWANRADGLPYASPEEALIMASIVEKETGLPEERPRVASVFINRLKQGMKLQSDPTIIYGLPDYDGDIRRKDILYPHPWNTYVIKGIPPSPIASPGAKAIEAALYPVESKNLFFVSRNDGTHVFSETYAEHSANVVRYQLRRGK